MGQIYGFCREVIIYLGSDLNSVGVESRRKSPPEVVCFPNKESSESIGRFVEDTLIEVLAPPVAGKSRRFGARHVFAAASMMSSGHLSTNPLFADDHEENRLCDLWEALRKFMHHPFTPWWQRMWVIQELALPRSATFMYGAVTAPSTILFEAAANYHLHSNSCCWTFAQSHPQYHAKVLADFSQRLKDIEELRTDLGPRQARPTLLSLLHKFRGRKSSDPRDKIYALLGLVRFDHGIQAEYLASSVADTYRTATLSMMHAGSLDVLASNSGQIKSTGDFPSWVPDWGASGNYGRGVSHLLTIQLYNAVPRSRVSRRNVLPLIKGRQWLDSVVSCEAEIMPLPYEKILLPGLLVDEVLDVTTVMHSNDARTVQNTLQDWLLKLESPTWCLSMRGVVEIWRLLCADVITQLDQPGTLPSDRYETLTECRDRRRAVHEDQVLFLIWRKKILQSSYAPRGDSYIPCGESEYVRAWTLFLTGGYESPLLWKSLQHFKPSHCDSKDSTSKWQMLEHRPEWEELRDHLDTNLFDRCSALLKSRPTDFSIYIRENPEWIPGWEENFVHFITELQQRDTVVLLHPTAPETAPLLEYLKARIQNLPFWKKAELSEALEIEELDISTIGQAAATVMGNSIANATLSRRLFVTRKGRVGLGPANTHPGDRVYLLPGGRIPFVLRKRGYCEGWVQTWDEKRGDFREGRQTHLGSALKPLTLFDLVGDCYVQRIMDGELMRPAGSNEFVWKDPWEETNPSEETDPWEEDGRWKPIVLR